MPHQFRHAICNECFEHWSLGDTCRVVRRAGYEGLEIAPFTLAEDPSKIPPAERAACRSQIAGEGLTFVGLHWLLAAPQGLHVTTPDAAVRRRSWDFVRHLVDLCADLGDNGVMVFGSPKQRCVTGGITPSEATRNYVDGLASVAGHAGERGVTILIEALPSNQCDVILSLAEAVSLVNQIGSPAVRTMFDVHNAVDESEPHAVLVDRYFDSIRHVHVNEIDGRHPGQADYDFKPVLQALKNRRYQGWVSLEAFDFSFGGDRIANESLRYLEGVIATLD